MPYVRIAASNLIYMVAEVVCGILLRDVPIFLARDESTCMYRWRILIVQNLTIITLTGFNALMLKFRDQGSPS